MPPISNRNSTTWLAPHCAKSAADQSEEALLGAMPLQCGSMHTRSPQLGRAQLTQCCTPSCPYPTTVHALLLPLPATAAQCTTHANNAHPLRHLLPLSANNRAHASAVVVHAHSVRNSSEREATHYLQLPRGPCPTSPTPNQPHPQSKQAVCRIVCVRR